jgi:hypothetical protein
MRPLQTKRNGKEKAVRSSPVQFQKLWLLEKLNSESTEPSTVRIRELLDRLQRIEALSRELYEQQAILTTDHWERHYPELDAKNQERGTKLSDLRDFLHCYQWTPQPFVECVAWTFPLVTSEEENQENIAAAWLLHQYGRGCQKSEIRNFKHCQECGKWFYGATYHHKFCGSKCRKHWEYKNTPYEKRKADLYKWREDKKKEEERKAKANHYLDRHKTTDRLYMTHQTQAQTSSKRGVSKGEHNARRNRRKN